MKAVRQIEPTPRLSIGTKLTLLDGIGLACGIFEHLLELKNAPKVIAATHFHEIFEHEFLLLRPALQLGHMEVKVSEESTKAEDQVTYLYKFVSSPCSANSLERS